jgi:hypothetical protein
LDGKAPVLGDASIVLHRLASCFEGEVITPSLTVTGVCSQEVSKEAAAMNTTTQANASHHGSRGLSKEANKSSSDYA